MTHLISCSIFFSKTFSKLLDAKDYSELSEDNPYWGCVSSTYHNGIVDYMCDPYEANSQEDIQFQLGEDDNVLSNF